MDKEKRKICLIMTLIGAVIIVVLQTVISIDDDQREKEENYIKVNAIKALKDCIRDEKCKTTDTTFKTLIKLNYFDESFLEKIEDYSLDSIVKYPSYEVKLKK